MAFLERRHNGGPTLYACRRAHGWKIITMQAKLILIDLLTLNFPSIEEKNYFMLTDVTKQIAMIAGKIQTQMLTGAKG